MRSRPARSPDLPTEPAPTPPPEPGGDVRAPTDRRGAISAWLLRDVVVPLGRTRSGAQRRISMTTILLAIPVLGAWLMTPGYESPVPLCFGYWYSGVPCPLCGMTRAVTYLTHGEWATAWRYHPAVFTVYPLLAMGLVRSVARDLFDRRMGPAWRRTTNVVGWATLMFILGFGAVRALGVMLLDWEPW